MGATPLMRAAMEGRLPVLGMPIAAGASTAKAAETGLTAAGFAREASDPTWRPWLGLKALEQGAAAKAAGPAKAAPGR